jgi:hypothetical protein
MIKLTRPLFWDKYGFSTTYSKCMSVLCTAYAVTLRSQDPKLRLLQYLSY